MPVLVWNLQTDSINARISQEHDLMGKDGSKDESRIVIQHAFIDLNRHFLSKHSVRNLACLIFRECPNEFWEVWLCELSGGPENLRITPTLFWLNNVVNTYFSQIVDRLR